MTSSNTSKRHQSAKKKKWQSHGCVWSITCWGGTHWRVSSWYFCIVARLNLTLHAMIIRTLWFPWWQDANVWLLENNLIRAALSQGAASKKLFQWCHLQEVYWALKLANGLRFFNMLKPMSMLTWMLSFSLLSCFNWKLGYKIL